MIAVPLSIDEFAGHFDEWADDYDDENDNEFIRASMSLVRAHASPTPTDTVLDLGTGTGALALALADDAGTVIGRDISERMLARAREKAAEQGLENVEFGVGRFRAPAVDHADIVVSNFALHHLDDEGKRDAIEAIAALHGIQEKANDFSRGMNPSLLKTTTTPEPARNPNVYNTRNRHLRRERPTTTHERIHCHTR